ncbi:hypothetical protein CJ030_MR2G025725 [Morella rubra]|uniref:PWWP domain-containing protein n=1 Tax=Morella rubra TaxID=262757 RepID=A0A6A1W7L1_9ROSI|nr:hypothetical protein CJ030_MR2G025725 [Morella rubra]
MAKKKKPHGGKAQQIDNFPLKYSQQPRSSRPKRRSDFSSFLCWSPLSNSDSLLGIPCGEVALSSVTMKRFHDRNAEGKKVHEHSLVQCSNSKTKGLRVSSNFSGTPVADVETIAQNKFFDSSDSNVSEQTSDNARPFERLTTKSQVMKSNGFCITPGSIVWAKTARCIWWPAEIMDKRSNLAGTRNEQTDGHVLVEFYGSQDIAWLDPARDLSQLEDCFEERSCNPMEDFQDALKQALERKEYLGSCRELFKIPEVTNSSDQQDQSSDKWTSSISSRAEDDFLERRRGKRERKRKLHFDEVTFPLTSAKKVRRFRIMQYLGLSAPSGSPFWPTHPQ